MPPEPPVPFESGDLPELSGSRFRLNDVLDSGAFATVYRATDAQGRVAAVKVLAPAWQGDAGVSWRFQGEYRRLSRLAHPAIPEALEAGYTAAGQPYFAMALVEGHPVGVNGPMGATEVRQVVAALADALSFIHGLGLVHGDLKPANVLIDAGGKPHLLDFGLVAPTGERREEVAGTLEYLAPEVFRRQPVHPAADLYALGALAYELWTGSPPFVGPPAVLARAHLQEPPPRVGERAEPPDAALEALIARLLAKAPGDRPPSAAAVAAALRGEAVPDAAPRGLVSGSFVGRQDLIAAWRTQLAEGGWMALRGEPGAGKSRALDELRLEAMVAGRVWVSAAARGEADAPGAPLRAAVGQALRATGHPASEPTRAWLAGETPATLADLEPLALQAAVRAAIAHDLTSAAGRGAGLAIGLDDWHLADAFSRELLGALRRATAGTGLAWALAAGDSAADELAEGVVLAPLSDQESFELLASRLGEPPSQALSALLLPVARGNPGLLELLLEHLVAGGRLTPALGGWELTARPVDGPLPNDGLALWGSRLARLTPDARLLAQAVAIAMPALPLPAPLLGAPSHLTQAALAAAIDELASVGVLVADADGGLRLAFAGLAPLLLADVPASVQTQWADALLAARLGDTVAAADLPAQALAGLARLALTGSDARRAVTLCAEAGRRSLAQAAYPDAAALLQAAEARLPAAASDEDRLGVLLPLAEAERQLGRLDAAKSGYTRVLELIDASDGATRALARIGLAKCQQMQGDYALALGELETAQTETSDDRARVRALLASSRIQVFQGHNDEALHTGRKALALAQGTGSPAVLAQALNVVGTLLLHADLAVAPEGLAMLEEARALAAGLGDRMGEGYVLDNVGNARLAEGALREAAEAFARSVALYREAGAWVEALAADLNFAIALGELAEFQRAGALARDVGRRAQAGGRRFLEAAARGVEAQAAWQGGDVDAASAPLADALATAGAIGNRYLELHLRLMALDAYLAARDPVLAQTEVARLQALVTPSTQADVVLKLAVLEAECLRQLGRLTEARERALSLVDAQQRWVCHRARQVACEVALALGAGDEALGYARSAGAIAEAWQAPWHRQADQLLEACALQLTGDMAGARRVAEQARTADRAAANPYAQAGVAALLASLPPAAGPARALTTAAGIIDPSRWLRKVEKLSAAGPEREIASAALAGIVDLVAADRGYVLLYEQGRLRRAITHAMDYQASDEAFSHTLAEHALFTTEPLYLMDACADPEWREAASVAALQLRTVVCLPLALPDQILGVVYVDRAAIEPLLEPGDVLLLQGLATTAAIAVGRERRRAAAEASAGHLHRARALAEALARGVDAGGAREALLWAAIAETGADRAYWLEPAAGGGLQAAAGRAASGKPLAYDAPAVSQGVIAWVLAGGEPLEVLDLGGDEDWRSRQSIQGLGLRTVWCVPTGFPDGSVLYLDAAQEPEAATESAMPVLLELLATLRRVLAG